MKSFKIALAQFSPHIGNIDANAQKMIEQALEDEAALAVAGQKARLHAVTQRNWRDHVRGVLPNRRGDK